MSVEHPATAVAGTSATRRWVLAVFPPLAALLLALGEASMPSGLDNPSKTVAAAVKRLKIAEAHVDRVYLASLLVIFGIAALGVSFAVIATLINRRAAMLATVAAVVGWVAAICGVITNVAVNYDLAATAAAHPDSSVAAGIVVHETSSATANALLVAYFPVLLLTFALMAAALWRSRTVPRWIALAFAVSVVLALVAKPGPAYLPLSVPLVVVMSILAARIRNSATPASSPEPSRP